MICGKLIKDTNLIKGRLKQDLKEYAPDSEKQPWPLPMPSLPEPHLCWDLRDSNIFVQTLQAISCPLDWSITPEETPDPRSGKATELSKATLEKDHLSFLN